MNAQIEINSICKVWNTVAFPEATDLFAVQFVSPQIGILAGDNSMTYYTVDGGQTWIPIDLTYNSKISDLCIINKSLAMIVDANGHIYISGNDWGDAWTVLNATSAVPLNSVFGQSTELAFAVGNQGLINKIYKDSNGTWQVKAMNSFSTENLLDITFADSKTGIISGANGALLRTTDGGLNWITYNLDQLGNTNINTVTYSDGNNIYLGGNSVYHIAGASELYSSKFYYDHLGRLIASQNTKQANANPKRYSYTLYDNLGRVFQAGQVDATSRIEDLDGYKDGNVDYNEFLQNIEPGKRTEVTRTYYNEHPEKVVANLSAKLSFNPGEPNLRGRVAYTSYFDEFAGDNTDNTAAVSIYYFYDIHGNVKTIANEIPAMGANNTWSIVNYQYDLISGNVKQVAFQPGMPEQFFHQYQYDAENRIVGVTTSTDGKRWEKDAKYFYYPHGPLARVEIGDQKIQAIDYAYTLQGWIKGVNSNSGSSTADIGHDGLKNHLNQNTPKDQAGFVIGYNTTDYAPINTTQSKFNNLNPVGELSDPYHNLYNGNIGYIAKYMSAFDNQQTINTYTYDQLNRIKTFDMYAPDAENKPGNLLGYGATYTYDANGNILALTRTISGNKTIDDFTYKYETKTNGFAKNTNRLLAVHDKYGNVTGSDLDNKQTFTPGNKQECNYVYDEMGNLTTDKSEEIARIEWTLSGKVKSIERTTGSKRPNLSFTYDPLGNRLSKTVTDHQNASTTTTWYLRDAQGNPMANYHQANQVLKLTERPIYGSTRLGVHDGEVDVTTATTITHVTRGNKKYELTDHLGNVTAVVTDRRTTVVTLGNTLTAYAASLISARDYYPFGMAIAGRQVIGSRYRFGFQGQEEDKETGLVNYKFRLHDPRIGRFFAIDPLVAKYPWNSSYAFSENRVVNAIELEGLEQNVVVNTYDANGEITKIQVINYLDANGNKVNMNLTNMDNRANLSAINTVTINRNPPDGTPILQFSNNLNTATRNYAILDGNIRRRDVNLAPNNRTRTIEFDLPGENQLRSINDKGLDIETPVNVTRASFTLNKVVAITARFGGNNAFAITNIGIVQTQVQNLADWLNVFTQRNVIITGNSSSGGVPNANDIPLDYQDENNIRANAAPIGSPADSRGTSGGLKQARATRLKNLTTGAGATGGRIGTASGRAATTNAVMRYGGND